jgi:hypothetical protein
MDMSGLPIADPRGYELRPASVADASQIAVFYTRCWHEAYRGIVPQEYLDRVTAADRQIRWLDRLTSGVRRTTLAIRDDQLIGVISWGRTTFRAFLLVN